jgi:hypothetical protein
VPLILKSKGERGGNGTERNSKKKIPLHSPARGTVVYVPVAIDALLTLLFYDMTVLVSPYQYPGTSQSVPSHLGLMHITRSCHFQFKQQAL